MALPGPWAMLEGTTRRPECQWVRGGLGLHLQIA